ncbi:hypothetical protein MRX96_051368 [Rhipicephalus microplus]
MESSSNLVEVLVILVVVVVVCVLSDLLGAGVGLLCVAAVVGSLLGVVSSTCHIAVEVLGSTSLALETDSCWKDSPVGSKCLRLRRWQHLSCAIT